MSYQYATDLCSAALVSLGDRPIGALDEPTDRARLAQALYGPTRDALLRAHPWSCARTRAVLDATMEAPAFGYPYGFLLPADCLRLLSVEAVPAPAPGGIGGSGVSGSGAGVCCAIEGRRLLATANPLQVLYVAGGDAADETQWDAGFRRTLTVALAAELAYPVTQSAALKGALEQQLQGLLRQARTDNAAEQVSAVVAVESVSLAARGGSVGGVATGPAGAWWERTWQVPSEPR